MFETEKYYVAGIDNDDISVITEIYNSDKHFLKIHLSKESVNWQWVAGEYQNMRAINFYSCKISDKQTKKIVGFMDFKIAEETYLSLIMLRKEFRSLGIGSQIISRFEEYAKSRGGKRIRIDVAADSGSSVLNFWKSTGYVRDKEITLTWDGNSFAAVRMIKDLD